MLPTYGAFAVKLKPAKRGIYPYKSLYDHDAGMGGVLAIEYIPAGTIRISLSGQAQLDAIQENQRLSQMAVERIDDCQGIARAVEVQSAGGPLILQISGADVELLKILVVPLPARGTGTTSGTRTVSALSRKAASCPSSLLSSLRGQSPS